MRRAALKDVPFLGKAFPLPSGAQRFNRHLSRFPSAKSLYEAKTTSGPIDRRFAAHNRSSTTIVVFSCGAAIW
jgi:hypothetical protein